MVGEVCGVYISVREACHKEVLMVWQKWCFVEVHNKESVCWGV